ncbi:MAG: biotin/lipoyl-binding protein [Maricaulaceae bacterium]|nr:biotin/lipoyl-binding protein [Maricaulaceae bacterium]
MFKTLLIANRGEIARRVIRTARRMGIRTIAVYSEADANALHVKDADEAVLIGPAPAAESYLRAGALLKAVKQTGAEAIHPGYGFLSENAEFAEACAKAGIVFVGPPPAAIRAMGLKDRAKALMARAGVPVTPGYHGDEQDADFLQREAGKIGWPVLIKAVAGGGGKGMRKVTAAKDFAAALESCRREAKKSFGDDRVLIEKFIENPRHIEVQVFGDSHGGAIHLYERDCSLQRRHQKVIEEAPAPGMTAKVREAMCAAAVQAAKAVDYAGAGTVEFIVDGSGPLRADGFFFMEMNTRLQVEHPVTEMITGLDLVELQLRVAAGGKVPAQDSIAIKGHAIEARLYAEDPESGFLPSTGPLEVLALPPEGAGIRVDSGVEQGGEVSLHYDPMIAKIIAHGPARDEAIDRLIKAMDAAGAYPVRANGAFLRRALAHPDFRAAKLSTHFIEARQDALVPAGPPASGLALAAIAALRGGAMKNGDPFAAADGWRLNAAPRVTAAFDIGGDRREATIAFDSGGAEARLGDESLRLDKLGVSDDGGGWSLAEAVCGGARVSARFMRRGDGVLLVHGGEARLYRYPNPEAAAESLTAGGAIKAPMPGKVLAVHVKPGDTVTKGQPLVVLEAMKMEHALSAPRDGVAEAVSAAAGAQVSEGDVLVALAEINGESAAED